MYIAMSTTTPFFVHNIPIHPPIRRCMCLPRTVGAALIVCFIVQISFLFRNHVVVAFVASELVCGSLLVVRSNNRPMALADVHIPAKRDKTPFSNQRNPKTSFTIPPESSLKTTTTTARVSTTDTTTSTLLQTPQQLKDTIDKLLLTIPVETATPVMVQEDSYEANNVNNCQRLSRKFIHKIIIYFFVSYIIF
jgi:hypothetical protein